MAAVRIYAFPTGIGRRLALVAAPSLTAARLYVGRHVSSEAAGEVRRATLTDLEGVVSALVSVPLVRANGRQPRNRNPYAQPADFGLREAAR